MVRHYLVEVLDRAGYETLPASNGPAALEILSERQDVRVPVNDIKMPLMDGCTLARQARRSRPNPTSSVSAAMSRTRTPDVRLFPVAPDVAAPARHCAASAPSPPRAARAALAATLHVFRSCVSSSPIIPWVVVR
jgi:CheY-like chemotaxis protein